MARVVIGNLQEDEKIRFLVHGAFCGALTRRELDEFGALALHLGGRLLCLLAARNLFTDADWTESMRRIMDKASDDLAKIRAKEGR